MKQMEQSLGTVVEQTKSMVEKMKQRVKQWNNWNCEMEISNNAEEQMEERGGTEEWN